jgi:hypothetical protein
MRQYSAGVSGRIRSHNDDGTITSVCSICNLIIARAFAAPDLQELERRHVCQPAERRREIRVVHRIYDPATPSAVDRPILLARHSRHWRQFFQR